MSNIRYWIWLSQAIGYCTTRYKQLVELYSDTDIFFEGGEPEWRLSGLFTNAEISKLNSTPLTVADEIISKCNKHCFEILPIDSPYYPKCLYNIDNPPAVIYIWGALPDIDDRLSIGVVGTRKASMYGIRSAHTISYELAKCGVTIVSGGALGIDTAAHMGCLAADGVTIAVLGCGSCATVCATGGEKEIAELKTWLESQGKTVVATGVADYCCMNMGVKTAMKKLNAQKPDAYYEANCTHLLYNHSDPASFAADCRELFKEINKNG